MRKEKKIKTAPTHNYPGRVRATRKENHNKRHTTVAHTRLQSAYSIDRNGAPSHRPVRRVDFFITGIERVYADASPTSVFVSTMLDSVRRGRSFQTGTASSSSLALLLGKISVRIGNDAAVKTIVLIQQLRREGELRTL